jgi:SAM-dependent methyltransferase
MLWSSWLAPRRLAAQCYDHFYGGRPDVPFHVGLAAEVAGPVLELGCGTGRVLVPVARETGLPVVGVDLDGHALDVLRAKLDREDATVRAAVDVVEGDLRTVALGSRFDLVTFPFRSFQELLTPEDRLAGLRTARRHLRDGGILLVDNFNPDVRRLADERALEWSPMSPPFVLPGGQVVRRADRTVERDLSQQTQLCEMLLEVEHVDGATERVPVRYRMSYQFRYEIEYLLALAGFEVERVYGDYDGGPFGAVYPGELIVQARPRPGV